MQVPCMKLVVVVAAAAHIYIYKVLTRGVALHQRKRAGIGSIYGCSRVDVLKCLISIGLALSATGEVHGAKYLWAWK